MMATRMLPNFSSFASPGNRAPYLLREGRLAAQPEPRIVYHAPRWEPLLWSARRGAADQPGHPPCFRPGRRGHARAPWGRASWPIGRSGDAPIIPSARTRLQAAPFCILCYHPNRPSELTMQDAIQDITALRARIDDLLVRL